MAELIATGLGVTRAGKTLLADASLRLRGGECVALIGPNGAGKTTFLRALLGLLPLSGGVRRIDDVDIAAIPPTARARAIAYLPQQRPLAWPVCVADIVALGRFAYGAGPGRLGADDAAAVVQAMSDCDIAHLAHRRGDTLSGGELARVQCARALAARTPFLFADEPVAALDPRHALRVMELLRGYVGNGGGALVVLHELDLAARYADRLVWMKDGRIVADGPPAHTLTPARLADVYGVTGGFVAGRVRIDALS